MVNITYKKVMNLMSPTIRFQRLSGVFFPLVVAALMVGPAGAQDGPSSDPTAALQRPCLLCNKEHDGDMHIEQYKGRWVQTCPECRKHWVSNKDEVFAKLQGRGALLDENSVVDHTTYLGWFFFGLYIWIGLLAGAYCAYMAVTRGHSPFSWFFMGLFLNLVAIVAVNMIKPHQMERFPEGVPDGLGKVSLTRRPVACPGCGAPVHPSADKCLSCNGALTPAARSEVSLARS